MEQQPQTPLMPPVYGPKFMVPTGKKEIIFLILLVLCGLALCNFGLFGGLNLGFGVMAIAAVAVTGVYLLRGGRKLDGYTGTLLGLSLVIAAGFLRSDDGFVKFVLLLFFLTAVNLSWVLMTRQNRFRPGGILSLTDGLGAIFTYGFGKMGDSARGVKLLFTTGGKTAKNAAAVLVGMAVAVPLLALVIPLLMGADAAFEGLIDLLPDFDLGEAVVTVGLGGLLGFLLYSRTVSMHHSHPAIQEFAKEGAVSVLTVNTALMAVSVVYLAYLFSQLAYFVGGFSGILPPGYTVAAYARRGFFEMTCLCGINLGIISLTMALAREGRKSMLLRILCLFVGLVTLFMVISSCAKMVLYIQSYGLTRLRVLTQVIILFLGIATALVCLWIFRPSFPYMKALLVIALAMGSVVMWVDVDTLVAEYNVSAYLQGQLLQVDIAHLSSLGAGAVPALQRLALEAELSFVREQAMGVLEDWQHRYLDLDLRNWNYAAWLARQYLMNLFG